VADHIVTASFGTEAFNQQVAQVNAITRIALLLPDLVVFGAAFWLVFRSLYRLLPSEEGKQQIESEFWDLVRLRDAAMGQASTQGVTDAPREEAGRAPSEAA
jgi:hypothetical protein